MPTHRPITILYVEEDPAVRFTLACALRDDGFLVREAANAQEALRLAADCPDLMLLDVRLPDLSGIDLCRRLKADPHTAGILVLYLSAQQAPIDAKAHRLEGGADGFLAKPADPRAVSAHIKSLLRLRQAETTTRAAAQQWRATFDAVRDGICLLDRAGTVLRCNRAMADLLNRSFLNIVGFPYEDLIRAAIEAGAPPRFARVHETGRRETAELALGGRWFRVSADPVLDEQGAVLGTVHLYADITERKHAEQTHAQLAAIVASSDAAIIGTTPDGRITCWNPAAQHLFGYDAEDVQGRPVGLLVPDDQAAELDNDLARVRRGERRESYETRWRRQDGSLLDVAVTVSPIRDGGGAVLGVSVIARDITAHKHLQEQFRQAQKMEAIGRLASGVAHDFNNLLTVILGYGQIVAAGLPAAEPSQPLVQEILRAGDRATVLTRQLLAFSRRQTLAPRVIDLNAAVADMEKMLGRLIGEDITLTIRLDSALEHVRADPGQIDQVLLNLAVNARDAMPDGGRLTITTANVELDALYAQANPGVRPGPYVLLTIGDTGTGIPKNLLPHIFEPFFTTKEVGKGSGLGLSTVYGIIAQSGGHIAVDTELGQGTTFRIYLPRTQAPLSSPPQVFPDAGTLSGQETILLVEDEEGVRKFAAFALRRHRYTVLEAADGAEALRLAGQYPSPIHLLLADVVLPEMSGRELAERLLALQPAIRVLYCSGYTSEAITRHGIQAAEQHFLQKPFRPEALARKVREVLDAPSL